MTKESMKQQSLTSSYTSKKKVTGPRKQGLAKGAAKTATAKRSTATVAPRPDDELAPHDPQPESQAGFEVDDDVDNDEGEQILRKFDMDMTYGPCLGISRLRRWERSHRLGLNPDPAIKSLLLHTGARQDCLWEGRV